MSIRLTVNINVPTSCEIKPWFTDSSIYEKYGDKIDPVVGGIAKVAGADSNPKTRAA